LPPSFALNGKIIDRMPILLLTSQRATWRKLPFNPNYGYFLPASRLQTYQDVLSAAGLKPVIQEIEAIEPARLRQYQAVIVACPFKNLSDVLLAALLDVSYRFGVVLISDTFLLDKRAWRGFGVTACQGLVPVQTLTDRQSTMLYRALPYPYSEQGWAFGIRPLLRLLLQNWLAKKLTLQAGCSIDAFFSGQRPAISRMAYGKAGNILLNFHPALVFKEGGAIHQHFRRLLEQDLPHAQLAFDLRHAVCLRMDDPGSCERVHLQGFNVGVIDAGQWQAVRHLLKREKAVLNIAYVPQWVDDGDTGKGDLYIQGQPVEPRHPGMCYPSWQVDYNKRGREQSHFYRREYQQIKRGVEEGVFSILSHGLTHLTTQIDVWLKADDRYTNRNWYREFREMATRKKIAPDILLQRLRMSRELLAQAFASSPKVLVPSAHEQTAIIPALAYKAGFALCSSRSLFVLSRDGVQAHRHLRAFYPSELKTAQAFVNAGFPVIFTFHDYDVYQHGYVWLQDKITLLRTWGITRFWALEFLAGLLLASLDVQEQAGKIRAVIQFPFVLTGGETVPLRLNRRIYETMRLNGQTVKLIVNDTQDGSLFEIPVAHVDSDNKLVIDMDCVDRR